ncbi:hypothetical protein CCR91_11790 [Thiorhodovibrio winogradskyi]|nr:hypothetical protein [Thiorhodovibrio winogradskyi]
MRSWRMIAGWRIIPPCQMCVPPNKAGSGRQDGLGFNLWMSARQTLVGLSIQWSCGLLLAALVSAPVAAASAPSAQPGSQPGLLVDVVPVEPRTRVELKQIFVGRVEARQRSELGFERGGRLTKLLVREGDQVAAGDSLARLDKSLLLAARAERLAELANAKAELALAEATARRYQASVADGAVTHQALDEAREGATAAAARVQLAQARIDALDLDVTKTELRAPFAGTIIARLADTGRVVAAGSPIVVLQEDSAPEIRIAVAGALADQLVPDAHYPLQVGDQVFTVRLRALLPVRSALSLTVDALFEPTEEGTAPRPGTPVELHLTKQVAEDGFWLPLAALSAGDRGLWRALMAAPLDDAALDAGRPERATLVARPLQMLHLGSACAFVRGALGRGDWVLAGGAQRVVPGQSVRTRAVPDPCAPPLATTADTGAAPRP